MKKKCVLCSTTLRFDKKHMGKKCFYTYLNVLIMKERKILLPGGFKIEFKPLHLYIELKFVWNIYFIELK